MTTASPPPAAGASPTPPTATTTTTTTTTAAAAAAAASLPIHTYHCICTQLILATTTPLASLPRRANNDNTSALLDRAYILPLPARPPGDSSSSSTGHDQAPPTESGQHSSHHYAILLNAQLDRRPRIVRRDDGLERRWVQRCARCACVVGYQLDWAHWAGVGVGGEKEGVEGEGDGSGGRTGWRRDVVFVLPGALVGTAEMASGDGGEKGKGKGL